MTNVDPWLPFLTILAGPLDHARKWSESHESKIVCHLLPDTPPEIIAAANALPVAIKGAGAQGTQAQAHIPGYTCSHAMGLLEMGLSDQLESVSGMVIPYTCDTTRNLFHIWNHCFPNMKNEFLRLPKKIGYPGASDYLKSEFSRLFASIVELTGASTDELTLSTMNSKYNAVRNKLRKAYNLHQTYPTTWTATRVQAMIEAFSVAPIDQYEQWLNELPWNESADDDEDYISVYVRGKIWDPPGLLDMFDKMKIKIVRDEMVNGYRFIESDAVGDDPIQALVNKHFNTTPYAGYHMEPKSLVNGFVERVKGAAPDGVVFVNPKFCEAAGFDTPDFKLAMDELKIPVLILETSARGVSLDQIRLRLEAFREMLSGDLN